MSGRSTLCFFTVVTFANMVQADSLSRMSLDDLSNLKIYSASKRSEDSFTAAASVYVITAEDLKKMQVKHVAEALRYVPGLQVERINSHKWMVTSRGFSEQFANKLLFLIDGRVAYTPLFTGVYWDEQGLVMDNIKQIEIIRGPGASIWGPNAANGVINIITKKAKDTQGHYASTILGTQEKRLEYRYGAVIEDGSHFRISGQAGSVKSFDAAGLGSDYSDGWEQATVDFRFDHRIGQSDSLTIAGRAFSGDADQTSNLPLVSGPQFTRNDEIYQGGHLDLKYQMGIDDEQDIFLHGYFDIRDRETLNTEFLEKTFSIEGQYDYHPEDSMHNIVTGIRYWNSQDQIDPSFGVNYAETQYSTDYVNFFVEDQFALTDELNLTLGNKIRYSTEDDFQILPTAKIAWSVTPQNILWASYSRAQRTPSLNTRELALSNWVSPTRTVTLSGNQNFDPEVLNAYEIGFKSKAFESLFFDVSAFYNNYRDLRLFRLAAITPTNVRYDISNQGEAQNTGVEVSALYAVNENWNVKGNYSFQNFDFSFDEPVGVLSLSENGKSPKHQLNLSSSYSVREDTQFNLFANYRSRLLDIQLSDRVNLSANIIHELSDSATLSVSAENILGGKEEFEAPVYGFVTENPEQYFIRLVLK